METGVSTTTSTEESEEVGESGRGGDVEPVAEFMWSMLIDYLK